MFGFCKTFKKITKNLGFHLTFKTADLQKIIFRSKANDINVKIVVYICLYPPSFRMKEHKLCLKNLIRKIKQSHMIHGIQNVNYQPMVMNFKSILVVPNMLIVQNF